ncbi:MAG: carboxypeptidase-like regulatory domain-containing protein, partial [Endomicrobiia bacterium]|nr:carboxypeptidase-like regulatory domain-containing protein [Endomicrobiia bacterium]
TGADGLYSISVQKGNYNIVASANGFFSQSFPSTIASGQTIVQDFSLTPMSSGTVRGTAWLNDGPIISQVVASSITAGSGFDQEYVELFNPTTSAWLMATGLNPADGIVGLKYRSTKDEDDGEAATDISLDYYTLSIPPAGYYLMANTTTIRALGVTRTADAVWNISMARNIIKCREDATPAYSGGGVGIYYKSNGVWLDRVGWTRGTEGGAKIPTIKEGNAIQQAVFGLERDEQFVRKTSTSGLTTGHGNSYDSDDNQRDFAEYRQPIQVAPRNSSNIATVVVAGKPAAGAVVSCNDGLSLAEVASAKGSPPYAEFILTSVATGTWNVVITSDACTMTVSSVAVATHGQVVFIPSALTVPTWPLAGYSVVLLSDTATAGFISGKVTNALGQAISPSIRVRAGLSGTDFFASAADGRYVISTSTGVYTVIANPDNIHTQYVSQTRDDITVNLGQITSGVNFVLSQGGRIRGWATRDKINPLPGISMSALDSGGALKAQAISGVDGYFALVNLSTGIYTVAPELDSKETSSPVSSTTTVPIGSNIFIGSFTITGAFGKITGNVRATGEPISTGVLIIASTSSFPTAAPPAISSQTITGEPYYMTNSNEDGTYILEVRGSTTTFYRVVAFYPRKSGSSFWTSTATLLNVRPLAGYTTANVNFSW